MLNLTQKLDLIPRTQGFYDKDFIKILNLKIYFVGIHLDESKRSAVVRLNEEILTLGQQFLSSSLQPRAVPKSKLPAAIRNQ